MEIQALPATVLVVDDAPSNLAILTETLRSEFDVRLATSGPEALRLVDENPPDLILLDIVMPDMDGYEVCRRLKAHPPTRNIPVIFLTAKGDVSDETMGLAIGAVDYIIKPVSIPIVQARVRTHVELKRRGDLLENPVHARRPDRHRQPPPLRRLPGPGLASGPAKRHRPVAGHGRHRLLQGLQRHLRPHGRR